MFVDSLPSSYRAVLPVIVSDLDPVGCCDAIRLIRQLSSLQSVAVDRRYPDAAQRHLPDYRSPTTLSR